MSFIVIPFEVFAADGVTVTGVENEIWTIDTDADLLFAKQRLAEHGVAEAAVWHGDADGVDAYKDSVQKVFAATHGGRRHGLSESGPTSKVALTLTEPAKQALAALAAELQCTRSEVVRRLLTADPAAVRALLGVG